LLEPLRQQHIPAAIEEFEKAFATEKIKLRHHLAKSLDSRPPTKEFIGSLTQLSELSQLDCKYLDEVEDVFNEHIYEHER